MRPAILVGLICGLLAGCLLAARPAFAEAPRQDDQVPRQGEYGELTKWDKYPYDIDSPYPYVKSLPPADQIPEIIGYIGRKKAESGIAESQLSCLTRISFDDHDYDKSAFDKPKAWQTWWKTVGKDYFKRVDIEGKRNPDAWKLLVGNEAIPCPDYKILIPAEWHFEVSFRAGDYGGVERETIRMERTKDAATLKRHYSINSTAPFQYEVWHGFTPQEADQFLYALGYAIDQPWFVKRFICTPPTQRRSASETMKVPQPGRRWGNYWPHATWSGVLLPDGRVWWNDDPWTWHSTSATANHEFGDTSLDVGCRLVYPFTCHHYPEKQSVAGSPGWEPDPEPPPLKNRPKNDWGK